MKSFIRSLRYLLPYKARLITAFICVILIASLWGAGIGMALPVLKIMMSPEGLHGWAWDSMSEDRLDATLEVRDSSEVLQEKCGLPEKIIDIFKISQDSPAAKAGIHKNWWILGIGDANSAAPAFQRGDLLLKQIAKFGAEPCKLEVMNSVTGQRRTVSLTLDKLTFGSEILAASASCFKEPDDYADRWPMLVSVLAIIVAMTLLREVLRFFQEYLVETAVFQGIMDLRSENFNVALHLPVTFFSQKGTSDTMSRFIQDTGELARGQNTLFGKTIVEPAKAVASIVGAFILLPKFTLIAAVAGPPVVILIRLLGKKMKKASRRALQSWSGLLAILEETLNGIRVVKTYTMEAGERKRFYRMNRQLFRQQRKMARIDASMAPIVEAFGITLGMLAAGGAGWLVLNGDLDEYRFMTWMGMLVAIFDPVRKLSKVLTRFQSSDAAAERIFELRDSEQEKRNPAAPLMPRHCKSIEFKHVGYTYPNAPQPALNDINIRFEAGRTIAIVGANGCGKTTLVSLIPRLLEPTEGQILIDGCDIQTHSIRSLRRQIGVVTQDNVVFHATVAENISYGLRRPSRDDVIAAAKKAYVDEFVREMSDGYDTMVGQHGATLSGGQRQRIAIARAILRDPAILIFDEALSQIDPDSEHKIYLATEEFIKGRTTFMIAHRFATILSADAIMVMDAAKIVDIGKHEELVERCEIYRHLYRTQFSRGE